MRDPCREFEPPAYVGLDTFVQQTLANDKDVVTSKRRQGYQTFRRKKMNIFGIGTPPFKNFDKPLIP